jgi:predicted transcriptional regulator
MFRESGGPFTFSQILQHMDPKLYQNMNNQRYRVQAALRKLLELGLVRKEDKDDKTLYKWHG